MQTALNGINLRIAYVIDHLRLDGTQRVLSQLVIGLAQRGHDQTVICLNDSWDDLLLKDIRSLAAEVEVIGKKKLLTGIGIWPIVSILNRKPYDAVVTFLIYSDIFGRFAAHQCRVPRIVSSIRARNIHYTAWQRLLVRWTMRWANSIVLNSHQIYEYAIQEESAPPEKVIIIPNGIDIEPYLHPVDRASFFRELGIEQDALLIGSVGRLDRQKGYDVLLNAMAQLHRQDIHLVLIGTGPEERALKEQMRSLHLSEQVHFSGYRRDVPRILKAFDLYIQPSRFEGMPNALMEAMAAGCPVIASKIDGIRDLVVDGQTGWMIEQEDINNLAQAILYALSNRGEAYQCGLQAQESIRKNYTINNMLDAWEQILSSPGTQDHSE